MNKMTVKEKLPSILLCIGTRPEGIKLAPVIKALKEQSNRFSYKICSTGQHKEMLRQVYDFFDIKPDYDFNLMTENQSLGNLSSRILNMLDGIIKKANPDIILVQGDTTTAFLTSLFAFYNKFKIGHVEAGLRTNDKFNPFPEEINRQLISRLADLHFVPTQKAFENLLNENIKRKNIFLTGNTIVDAINWAIKKVIIKENRIIRELPFKLAKDKRIILVTMHRRESFGKDIENVCTALKEVAKKYKNFQIIYPVHLNPNVKIPVYRMLDNIDNITLTTPLSYESFVWLMLKSYFMVTDSGGVQEEATTLNKPVLIIRKKTERDESVDLGISKLIGINEKDIIDNISSLIENQEDYKSMIAQKNPYGDGNASGKILDAIYSRFQNHKFYDLNY